MNFETTKQILEKLKQYINPAALTISTESIDYHGNKYNADLVWFDVGKNLGIEVSENEIIVLYFTTHSHFENYENCNPDYIDCAVEFLEELFTFPIRQIAEYRGKRKWCETYYFIKDGRDEHCGNTHSGCLYWAKPYVRFARFKSINTVWKYDCVRGEFVKESVVIMKKPWYIWGSVITLWVLSTISASQSLLQRMKRKDFKKMDMWFLFLGNAIYCWGVMFILPLRLLTDIVNPFIANLTGIEDLHLDLNLLCIYFVGVNAAWQHVKWRRKHGLDDFFNKPKEGVESQSESEEGEG